MKHSLEQSFMPSISVPSKSGRLPLQTTLAIQASKTSISLKNPKDSSSVNFKVFIKPNSSTFAFLVSFNNSFCRALKPLLVATEKIRDYIYVIFLFFQNFIHEIE